MNLAQLLVNGLVSGLIIALPAIATSLVFGVFRFPNFAVGAQATLGAFAAYAANALLGLSLPLAALLGAAAGALAAMAVHRGVYRRLRERGSITLLVASIGVAFVLENLVRFFAGNEVRGYDVAVARPIRLLDLRFTQEQLVIAATTILATTLLALLLSRTRLGRAMRAMADNPDLAAARGIDAERVSLWTWGIVGVLTALAGVLTGLDGVLEPSMGWRLVVPVFAAAILGGLGDPRGAFLGALLLGIVEEVSVVVVPNEYRLIVAFVILGLVLLVRPSGLFGRAELVR